MRLRAPDKLREAGHFLDELTRSKDDLRKFRWNLAAVVTSLRSVTHVLQKDLRAKFGQEFDKWYDPRASAIGALPDAKKLLHLRNVVLKEGNRLPLLRLTAHRADLPDCLIELDFDPSTQELVEISCKFGGALDPVPLPDGWPSDERQQQLPQEAVFELLRRTLPQAIEAVKEVVTHGQRETSFIIDDNGTRMRADELIGVLREHLGRLENLVSEAAGRFDLRDET